MTTINQLAASDSLCPGDQFPIFSTANGDARKVSLNTITTYMRSQLADQADMLTQYSAPNATDFQVTVSPATAGQSVFLLLTPVAGFASGSIGLPAAPEDKQEVLCSCTQLVSTLAVSGNGYGVNGAPATLAANSFFKMRYDAMLSSWFRVG
jgi:hypothetical protein